MKQKPRREGSIQVVVQLDLDVDKPRQVEPRTELRRLVVLHIEIQQIQHRLHDRRTAILPALCRKRLDFIQVLTRDAGRELDDGHGHGERRALDGDKGLVHVDAHGVGGGVEAAGGVVGRAEHAADDFDEELLRVARAKVEADGLEDEAF